MTTSALCASCSSARRWSRGRRWCARRCWPAARRRGSRRARWSPISPTAPRCGAAWRCASSWASMPWPRRAGVRAAPTASRSRPASVDRWMRMARLVRTSLETNGGICRSLLQVRHDLATSHRRLRHEGRAAARSTTTRSSSTRSTSRRSLGPLDVIVRIGAAGLCRTDLHIQEGQWAEKSQVELPYTPGHENAGWIHEIGSGVTQRRGRRHRDRAPVHLLRAVPGVPPRRRHALRERLVPGHQPRRRVRRLPAHLRPVGGQARAGLEPKDIAALADAGLTAIHAVKKAIPVLGAGTRVVVIGAGGLGHIGIQCLKAYTPAEIIVVDPSEKALALAGEMGADKTVKVDGSHVRHRSGADRRGWCRGDHRLRRREGRDRGRHRDDPGRRVLLRHRLRRERQRPDDRHHLARDLASSGTSSAPTSTSRT